MLVIRLHGAYHRSVLQPFPAEDAMEELKKYYNPDTGSDPAPFLPQCPQYESHIQRTGYPGLLEALLL